MDSLINQASKYWFLTGERQSVPARDPLGRRRRRALRRDPLADADLLADGRAGAEDRRPLDAGRRQGAAEGGDPDPNPVLFFEHKRLYSKKGPLDDPAPSAIGQATVVREGSDVTLVSAMKGVDDCLEAAEPARRRRASTRRSSTCRRSARSTSRRSCARSRRPTASPSSRRARAPAAGRARCSRSSTEQGLGDIDDALRITTPDTPIPYSPPLEDDFLPGPQRIADAVRARL